MLRLRSCSKFFDAHPPSKFFQIWESESYSNSGNHRCNRNLAMFVIKQ